MKKTIKLGILVGSATATATTVFLLAKRNQKKDQHLLTSKKLDELAQPTDRQEEKMVSEGAQTSVHYVNQMNEQGYPIYKDK